MIQQHANAAVRTSSSARAGNPPSKTKITFIFKIHDKKPGPSGIMDHHILFDSDAAVNEECEFEEKTRNISIDPKSLAKGSARVAHPCQVQGSVFDLSSLIITEPVKGRAIDLVAKIYKNHSQNTNYVHQSDAQCLWVANQSWVAFLEHARTCADQGQAGAGNILESMDGVSFVDGSVYELEGSYSFPVVFVEACIPGTFTKYQSNAKFGQQTTAAQIMDCFSHYTIGDAGRTSRVAIPVASRAAHGPLATC
ncbi:hypothetical protein BDR26DRAFT_940448 [Obelidium mucronatum]|nr:hypothetical protein BDR26DRAFT_940448 [Obelidium mucronatum]